MTTSVTHTGGFFSQFHLASSAEILPALNKIIQNLAQFETFFNQMMNKSIQGQVASSTAAADATKSGLVHQANGLEDQAISGITSAAAGLAMTGLTAGLDFKNASEAQQLSGQINNGEAFQHAYENRVAQASVDEKTGPTVNDKEISNRLSRHVNQTDEVIQKEPDETDYVAIQSTTPEEKEAGIAAMKQAVAEKKAKLQTLQERFQKTQTYSRMLNDSIQQSAHAGGNFAQAAETTEQGKQEKLKILETSTQELSKSIESQNGQQASQTAQQMGELMGLFSQLSAASGN